MLHIRYNKTVEKRRKARGRKRGREEGRYSAETQVGNKATFSIKFMTLTSQL